MKTTKHAQHAPAQLPNLLVLALFAAPEAQWLGGHRGERDPGTGQLLQKDVEKAMGEPGKSSTFMVGFPHLCVPSGNLT